MELCSKIKSLRLKAGMTQAELAERLGFRSSSVVTMWENGSRKPSSSILPGLATDLNCSIADLYGDSTKIQLEWGVMNDLKRVRAAIVLLLDVSTDLPPDKAEECIAVSNGFVALHAKLTAQAETLQELLVAIDDISVLYRRLT